MAEGTFPLTNGLRGVKQRGMDILGFKVGEAPEDLVGGQPFGDHADDGGHGNAKPTNARNAVHLLRVDRDSLHDGECFRDADTANAKADTVPRGFTASMGSFSAGRPLREGLEHSTKKSEPSPADRRTLSRVCSNARFAVRILPQLNDRVAIRQPDEARRQLTAEEILQRSV